MVDAARPARTLLIVEHSPPANAELLLRHMLAVTDELRVRQFEGRVSAITARKGESVQLAVGHL